MSTDWSFDECGANVNAPDTSHANAATKHADVIHYDYNFATDGDSNKGAVSFYDVAYATSVLQKQIKQLRTGNEMGILAIRKRIT